MKRVPEVSINKKFRWWPLILFLIAFVTYANTLNFNYAGDDKMYTYENSLVQKGIAGIPQLISHGTLYGWDLSNVSHYRPVTLITYALEKSLYNNDPGFSHLVNIILYCILCILIFTLLKHLFSDYRDYLPAFITLLFILHPVHSEVVSNIKSRDEILSMLFGILSITILINYILKEKYYLLLLSLFTFFLCINSKEVGFSFLLVVPLVLYFFYNLPKTRIIGLTSLFLLVVLTGILIRFSVLDSFLIGNHLSVYANSLLSISDYSSLTATKFSILLYALKLLLLPTHFSWDYSYNYFPEVGWTNFPVILSFLIHFVLLIYAAINFRQKNIFSFAILYYFISYFMMSNFAFLIGSTFGERFLFMPSLGFCLALTFLLASIFKIELKSASLSGAWKITIVLSCIFLFYFYQSVNRNKVWKDDNTLYTSGIKDAPESSRARFSYASNLYFGNNYQNNSDNTQKFTYAKKALEEYQKGVLIYPDYEGAYFDMGLIYYTVGEDEKALGMYKKALEIKPNLSEALNNSGLILYSRNEYSKALELFLKANEGEKLNQKAFAGAASCYMELKQFEKAISFFEKAVRADSSDEYSRTKLVELYLSTGDTTSAVQLSRSMRNR